MLAGEIWRATMHAAAPTVALVAIHGFERPGREGYWQRHGIASVSAALGGLAVGSAHYRRLTRRDQLKTPLASSGVPREHLGAGIRRRSQPLAPTAAITIVTPSKKRVLAVLRLFEGSIPEA
jgi:hypothetical protein